MEAEKKKSTSAKSLEAARKASYFGKKMLKNAHRAHQEGRPVGWSMVTFYEGEMIAKAMGIELVFPENYGAFCAAVGRAQPYLERCDSDGFPSTLCGYARNCIGYASMMAENNMKPPPGAPGGGLPKPNLFIGSGAICDGRFKWFQALKRYIDVPLWTLERPQTGVTEFYLSGHKEKAVRFITTHLKEFVSFLERFLGTKMNWDRLEEIVDQTFKTLALAHEVDLLRRAVPSPLVAQDFWAIMIAHLYMPYDPEAYEFYKKVYDEVKYRVDNKIGAVANEKYRMMFAELPPWHSLSFFDKLAENHGIAMVYESWNYHAPLPIPDDELERVSDPLERIALLTYCKYTEVKAAAKKYDIHTPRTGGNLRAAPEYKADGIICHPLRSCRPATYELLSTKNILEEKLKIPGVMIDGDIVDLRVFNEEEALSKMEAFVETMDNYREQRKKAEMPW
jgi:benzoyl-CoA reductase/2-hydroxyglutaryl-CoA dehydratase subunit BcrC/BadD/HgdB